MGNSEPTIRPAVPDDLGAIGEIYAHHVRNGVATFEDSIYLAPDAVGLGIGGRLLDALLTRCSEVGVRQVIAVIVDDAADVSLALHRNRGFVDAGRLSSVGFKHGRWLDTLLLQRSLTAAGR